MSDERRSYIRHRVSPATEPRLVSHRLAVAYPHQTPHPPTALPITSFVETAVPHRVPDSTTQTVTGKSRPVLRDKQDQPAPDNNIGAVLGQNIWGPGPSPSIFLLPYLPLPFPSLPLSPLKYGWRVWAAASEIELCAFFTHKSSTKYTSKHKTFK